MSHYNPRHVGDKMRVGGEAEGLPPDSRVLLLLSAVSRVDGALSNLPGGTTSQHKPVDGTRHPILHGGKTFTAQDILSPITTKGGGKPQAHYDLAA